MQRIEKYGVIALVFLLVTILAVSLWSQKNGKSPFSFLKRSNADQVASNPPASSSAQNPIGSGQGPMGQNVWSDPANPNVPLNPQASVGGPQAQFGSQQPMQSPANANVHAQPNGLGNARMQPFEQGQTLGNDPLAVRGDLARRDLSAQPEGFVNLDANVAPGAASATRTRPEVVQPRRDAAAPASSGRTYVVKSGDTLGDIAARELGEFDRWTEIAKLNGNLDPKRMRTGMKLAMPAGGAVAKKASSSQPSASQGSAPAAGGSYVVRRGDTLSAISSRTLGDADRWNEIAKLNPGIDPNRLKVGARLTLPQGATARVASATVAKATPKGRVR